MRPVLTCCLTLFIAVAAAGARAEEPFVSLFNGRDLAGWHGDPELWKVVDGVIVGSTDGKQIEKNSFLITDRTFKNFVLKAKFRLRNHNSGIQFRSQEGQNFAVTGYQADIADKRYTGILHEEGGKLIVADVNEPELLTHYKPGDWAEYVITADGPHITQQINGYTTIDFTEPDEQRKAASGVIALQLHKGPNMQVEFKDLEIRELP